MTHPLVLVVDDDPDTREALTDVLVGEGFAVEIADEGETALRLLREAERLPDVILLDLMMPGMDGATFRAKQLDDPALRDIPVAVFSAHVRAEEAAEILRAEAFLEKPLSLDELLKAVNRLIDAHKAG